MSIDLEHLLIHEDEQVEGLFVLTINRENKLNALNPDVIEELRKALVWLDKQDQLKGLVLTGAGEKAFIVGADILAMKDMSSAQSEVMSAAGHEVTLLLENFRAPVVAAVNGYALGGGLEMAMACDFIYASENAIFGLPEVSLGLIPGFGGSQRLHKYVGLSKAKQMMFSAMKLDAQSAKDQGLVLEVFEDKKLLTQAVRDCFKKIFKNSPVAIATSKKAINLGHELDMVNALKVECKAFGSCFETQDMKEGVSAFLEKRKPIFRGE